MTTIPANTVSQEDLNEWFRLQDQLKKVKAAEMLLRQKIFGFYFPAPKEGTNSVPLTAGWVLKGKHSINRDVDIGTLGALKPVFAEAGIRYDDLVAYKPSLVLSEYRTLTEEQHQLFDRCLIIKPGSPALEIVLPAKAKKAGETA
jgi:hypothetical protein